MPPVNHAAISAGVIALSVAVAAAIAVYESPELRRMADDLRRRIAVALHSIGDGITPPEREPLFNRPEDAEGFLRSRGISPGAADSGVEGDEETLRQQREELMYWNRLHLEKQGGEQEKQPEGEEPQPQLLARRGSSFDDFLAEDKNAERGTYVFNTGADVRGVDEGLVRRRGTEGVRGLNSSIYHNPFGDEHGIDIDERPVLEPNLITPADEESMSDMYDATPVIGSATLASPPPVPVYMLDRDVHTQTRTDGTHLVERELSEDEFMTAGQDDASEAYASIQAWAQGSSPGFYSPLPVSPAAPLSEPEVISEGALTPAYSASLAGSGVDVANDARSERSATEGRYYDVMSDDEDGVATPNSWSEVGSVVSESEAGAVRS